MSALQLLSVRAVQKELKKLVDEYTFLKRRDTRGEKNASAFSLFGLYSLKIAASFHSSGI
jgi:hypothetical protein